MSAVEKAKALSASGPKVAPGLCLRMVRTCYGVDSRYPDASTAWMRAEHKHPTADPENIPRGVPIWWTGGSHGYGHVAISAGGGWCWSTDIKRVGMFDRCRVRDIHNQWGLRLAGWSEDINGVRVWSPPTKSDGEDWFDMATKDEVKDAFREVLEEFFRDDGGLPDIGKARVASRDGKSVLTLSDLLYRAAGRK